MIGRTVTHYRILEELGGGGMGVVYKAEDTRLGRQVAVKFLSEELSRDSDAIQRFQREARAASSLNHPNICTIYEFDEHEGRQFIVMELMEGQTLKDRIGDKPLPAEEIISLAAQITEGLAAAHQRGIIHRDIKPANLFVTENGLVKVLDFGVAKLLPREEDATVTGSQTAAGSALGTLAYMAPEQLNREKVDARTDIYALGCVLYEMATGRRPFAKEFGAQMIANILSRMPEPPSKLNPEVSARMDEIILKCLAKEPVQRYQSAKELQAELRRFTEPATEPAHPVVSQGRTGLNWPRMRWVVVGVAIVLLFAVLLGLDVGGWRTQLLGGAAPPKIDSLAVLPLENLSGDSAQDYFADGMTEALITDLGRLKGLKRVIARGSVMRYEGTKKPLSEIARELKVDALITGAVLRSGDRVRITAQLINPTTEGQLWADSYERDLRDVLSLQYEIVAAITREIELHLTPQEQARMASAQAVNPEAYEDYLKGRFHWQKYSRKGFDTAMDYFQLALQKDPNYALAYTGIGVVWGLRGSSGFTRPSEAFPKWKQAIMKALELDPTLPEAQAHLAGIRFYVDWDWPAAERELQRAVELNPNYPDGHIWYSQLLSVTGRSEAGVAEMRRALELDPHSSFFQALVGYALLLARHDDDAIAYLQQVLRTDPSMITGIAPMLAPGLEKEQRYEEALAARKQADLSRDDNEAAKAYDRGYAQGGYRGAMRSRAELAVRRSEHTFLLPTQVASFYASAGEKERAIAWLEKGYQERESDMVYLKLDPQWDTLRDEPRFQALLRRMNFP